MHKGFLKTAALGGALSVALGAFAAHGLNKFLSPENLTVFETAIRYQFYHILALLAVGILYGSFPSSFMKWAGYLFVSGILLFSGSLYLLCFIEQYAWPLRWVGAITPLGGAAFIAGWIMFFVGLSKKN